MSVVLATVGAAIVLLALADLFSTTVSVASVNGIVSGKAADAMWRRALRLELSHRCLRTVGMAIVVALISGWAAALWLGWSLVYLGAGDAIVSSSTGVSANAPDRIFYAGYLMSTMGNGDFTADRTGWQIVSNLTALSGLVTVTLAITFLVPVASGVVHRRQVASAIALLGATPATLLRRAHDGTDVAQLGPHIQNLISDIQLLTQRHMAYPVLHYFHSNERHAAIAPMVAVLDETTLLLRFGAAKPGVDALTLDVLRDSIAELLRLLEHAFIRPAAQPPPPPDLDVLDDLGMPTADADAFTAALDDAAARRQVLCGFVEADGWSWSEVHDDPPDTRRELGATLHDRDGTPR